MKDEEKTQAQLIDELSELRQQVAEQGAPEGESRRFQRQEIRQKVHRWLRDAVATMQRSDEIHNILSVLKEGLRELEIPFHDCGINLVDSHRDPAVVSLNSLGREGEWLPSDPVWGQDIVFQFWKAGVPVYRRDLETEDIYDERKKILEYFGHPVRCVLDVPFVYGTIAINSERPDAFSEQDMADLGQLAVILEEGFRRREDLQNLEQRNRVLEDEITERKRAAEALKQTAEQLSFLTDSLPIVPYTCKAEGDFVATYISSGVVGVTGYQPENFTSNASFWADHIHPDDRPRIFAGLNLLLEKGFHEHEYRWQVADGSYHWFLDILRLIKKPSGTPDYIAGAWLDITTRKQTEEALRANEETFRTISVSAQDAILMMDDAGEITYWNEAAEKIFGYAREEAVGQELHSFLAPQRFHEAYRQGLAHFKTTGEGHAVGQTLELAAVRKDGTEFPIELSLSAVKLKDRWHAIGILRDITARKQAEKQILRQSIVLNAINQVFSEAMQCETPEEVAHTCLAVAEDLTGSPFGFIGELNQAGRFDTMAISNPGWNVCTMPNSNAVREIKNMEVRGIDRSTLKEEKSRIVNDPASHPDRVGTPEGHPSITSFLGVPLKQGSQTIGMIGLANKESGYNLTDQENVESLAVAFVEALYRKRAEEAQRQANRLLRLLSQTNQVLVRSSDEPTLMQDICRSIVEEGRYRLAWVGWAEQDSGQSVRPVAQWGFEEGYLATLNLTWADTERGRSPTGTAIRTGKTCVIQHLQTDPTFALLKAEAELRGYAAVIALPLSTNGQCLGALNIYASEPNAFDREEIELLEELAADLAYGFTALRVRAEHQQFAEDLQIDLSLQRLRNEILQMQSEQDWEKIVLVFHTELKNWVLFNACSINLINVQEDTLSAYAIGPRRGLHQNVSDVIDPVLKKVLETGKPVYRPCRENPLWGANMAPEVHSIVDVPFAGGTIAINSTEEDAFSPRDIEILERVAQVISEAYRRLTDLRALSESEERFRQAQKMEAIGQLAGGVAHDFNNLLTIISGYSQMLLKEFEPGAYQRVEIKEIRQAADRGQTLVQQLLAFSRRQTVNLGIIDLNILVADMEKMLQRLLGEDVVLSLELAPALGQVFVDEGQLNQILMNLAVNARDAMPDGGRLLIETTNVELKESNDHPGMIVTPGPYVQLSTSDTGEGMDAETREHIFEPFFTTKGPGKGTGLGLAMVYGIVKQSEGYIWVYSEPGQGTTFRIYLPRVGTEGIQEDIEDESDTVLSQGTETILVVEDDKALRQMVRLALKEQGYAVLDAENGRDAIQIAEQHGSTIRLLLTDVIMPEMNGRELAHALTPLHPDMKVLFMSGYPEGIVDRHGVLDPGIFFLPKPFAPDDLAQKVRKVLDASPQEPE